MSEYDENQKGPQYRSRLAGNTAPTRGIGSAYAANHAVIGSQDPTEAARLSSMSPEEAAKEQERSRKLEEELEQMREDVFASVISGNWAPDTSSWPQVPDNPEAWRELINKQPAGMISRWHRESKEHIDSAIDAQGEEELKESLNSIFAMDAADPLYEPMTDKMRRKAIEDKLEPLDFENMVFQGYCLQDVEARKGFTLTFRTMSTQHGLWVEYMISRVDETSMQHGRHLYSLMQVAASLDAINGRSIGPDLTKFVRGDQRDEFLKAMEERMEFLGKLPSALTDDLIVQFIWFAGRVRKLMTGDLMSKVGNS